MVGDHGQWTSGQVGSSHLMKSWDTITTGRDYCLVPSALFRQWDFGRKFLDITQTPLLQNPFLIFIIHWPQLYKHTSKSPKTWSESVSWWRDETAVSELLTLTDPLSKLSFAKLPKVYSPSDSISESKVVTAAKLMILVFEHKPGESIYSARHKSTEVWKGKKSKKIQIL